SLPTEATVTERPTSTKLEAQKQPGAKALELVVPESLEVIGPEPPTSTEPEVQMLLIPPTEPEAGAKSRPAQPFRLWLFNTSFSSRKGHVTHDWQSIFNV